MAKTPTPTHQDLLRGSLKDLPEEVKIEVSRIMDLAASCGRLALIAHGIAKGDSPAAMSAWEGFLRADDATQSLAHLLDYGPVEMGA